MRKSEKDGRNKAGSGWRAAASFTVEAAFLMPVVILLLVWTMHLAVGLYTRVDAEASDLRQIEQIDAVRQFINLESAKDLLEAIR